MDETHFLVIKPSLFLMVKCSNPQKPKKNPKEMALKTREIFKPKITKNPIWVFQKPTLLQQIPLDVLIGVGQGILLVPSENLQFHF